LKINTAQVSKMYEKQVTDFKDIASLSSSDIFVLLELILSYSTAVNAKSDNFCFVHCHKLLCKWVATAGTS